MSKNKKNRKITVLLDTLQSKEAVARKCFEKFLKIPKSFNFCFKNTPPRVIFWEFPRIFQSSCFKEYLRTSDSAVIWGNRRDSFLLQSTRIIRTAVQKILRKLPRKILCWLSFFYFTYQNNL